MTLHQTVSMDLHPDKETALTSVGDDRPLPPQSGIGKDPRKKYEDLHWTEEEKAGYDAYIKSVQNKQAEVSNNSEPESRLE